MYYVFVISKNIKSIHLLLKVYRNLHGIRYTHVNKLYFILANTATGRTIYL